MSYLAQTSIGPMRPWQARKEDKQKLFHSSKGVSI